MLRSAALSIALVTACGGGGDPPDGVDAPTPQACIDATMYQDIQNIEEKIFRPSCIFSGCHNGAATDAGRLDLRAGMAHANLVDIDSEVDSGKKLVVAGDPGSSYLLLMMGHIAPGDFDPPTVAPPGSIGLMPQGTGGVLLCREKSEAIERWIMGGAQP
jgi:hypothetical protein